MVRGSYVMQRFIEAAQGTMQRSGRSIPRQRLKRLSEARVRLETNTHLDTVGMALHELARMTVDAICASPRTPQQRPQRGPQRTPQPSAQPRRGDDDVALYVTRRRGR